MVFSCQEIVAVDNIHGIVLGVYGYSSGTLYDIF